MAEFERNPPTVGLVAELLNAMTRGRPFFVRHVKVAGFDKVEIGNVAPTGREFSVRIPHDLVRAVRDALTRYLGENE